MIRPTDSGRCYTVTTDDGRVLAIVETRAVAERIDAARGSSRAVQVQVSSTLHAALTARASLVGVSVTTYVRSVLEAHAAGRTALEYREAKPGMGSASPRTRTRVSRAGVKGRKNKENDRG